MKKRTFKLAGLIFLASALSGNAFAQTDDDFYSVEDCQRIATRCANNYSALGYPRGNECFDAISQGKCPDRGGNDGFPGDRSYPPSGREVTLCGGTQGRLGGCG